MNILITSAGRRVKIVEYFKENFNGKGLVVAADCDIKAPALYFADEFELIPRIDSEMYLKEIINVCKQYDISTIISLLDPELEVLALNKAEFDNHDIKLILSPIEMIQMSFDKQKTHNYLVENKINVVPTFNKLDAMIGELDNNTYTYPLVVKPGKGSASQGLHIIRNEEELRKVYKDNKGLIIQPFYCEKEYGVDVYIDIQSGELVDLFIKEKLLMRSGETDKSISRDNKEIEKLVIELISKTNFRGPIDIDCFKFEGTYYISEINPRFGGGYPHAYESGCDFMSYIINNLKGYKNEEYKSFNYNPGLIMMKHDEIKMIKE